MTTENEPDDGPAQAGRPKKACAAEVERRVNRVIDLLLGGAGYADITQVASSEGWPLGERHMREYMRRASDILKEQNKKDREEVLSLHLARRERLYAMCLNNGELKTALDVLKDLAEVQGLYPPKATVATSNVNVRQQGAPMSDAELDAILGGQQP